MKVNVRLFARARDLAGAATVSVEIGRGATVGVLRGALIDSVPELAAVAGSLHVAVNGDYADDSVTIPPHAELACFPPVSGG